jgi:hypothetical protein
MRKGVMLLSILAVVHLSLAVFVFRGLRGGAAMGNAGDADRFYRTRHDLEEKQRAIAEKEKELRMKEIELLTDTTAKAIREVAELNRINPPGALDALAVRTVNGSTDKPLEEAAAWIRESFLRSQNPPDCVAAKVLQCQILGELHRCGTPCAVRQLAYCAVVALATRRVVSVDSRIGTFDRWSRCAIEVNDVDVSKLHRWSIKEEIIGTKILTVDSLEHGEAIAWASTHNRDLFLVPSFVKALGRPMTAVLPWFIGVLESTLLHFQHNFQGHLNAFTDTLVGHWQPPVIGVASDGRIDASPLLSQHDQARILEVSSDTCALSMVSD